MILHRNLVVADLPESLLLNAVFAVPKMSELPLFLAHEQTFTLRDKERQ